MRPAQILQVLQCTCDLFETENLDSETKRYVVLFTENGIDTKRRQTQLKQNGAKLALLLGPR